MGLYLTFLTTKSTIQKTKTIFLSYTMKLLGKCNIFNTYGPNMRINDGRIIPNFIIQALNEESLIVY